jgi:DNA-binding CsgD family transcriptional regulator
LITCAPHRERGLSVPAQKTVAGTPMCEACFAGLPISDEVDELDDVDEVLETLLKTARAPNRGRGPRRAYGIRTAWSAEQTRRRRERIRTMRPRTSWRRGRKELKLEVQPRFRVFRQPEVLTLLARGLSNSQIAIEMGITVRTVKFHLSRLFKKSGTKNRMDLLLWHIAKSGAIAPAPPENSLVQIEPGTESWPRAISA